MRTQKRGLVWLICWVLLIGTLAAYCPLFWCEFTNYDDPDYVTHNSHVKLGLTLKGVAWAFTTQHGANWHPLTWISHMADCELYGLEPGGHHLTSLFLHMVNTLLLFGLLLRFTGALWRSALVAALFAWHPLHVESVAWVSERKDVLSAFFWFLAIRAYGRYAEESKVQSPKSKVAGFYFLSLLFFVFGLMSKPMVVTLPFVLLLLDYWPLGRIVVLGERTVPATRWSKLLLEKSPFFLLAVVSSVITFFAQKSGGAVSSLQSVTFPQRLANAPIAYVRYLGKMLLPRGLAVIYPLHPSWAAWQIVGAVFLLGLVTFLAVAARRSRPYLPVGWFLFLGMLVPVIGLVQVGAQSMADRYTYLPLIGVFVMLVWGAAEAICSSSPGASLPLHDWQTSPDELILEPGGGMRPDSNSTEGARPASRPAPLSNGEAARRKFAAGVAAILLTGCMVLTWFQARTWTNSCSLFSHALAVKAGGAIAHMDLGQALGSSGRLEEGLAEYRTALQMKPGYPVALVGIGLIYNRQGKTNSAIECFSAASRNWPNFTEARYNLAVLLATQGKIEEAIDQYHQCLRLEPDLPEVHYNLANALVSQGHLAEAAEHYLAALRLEPNAADTHNNLGAVLVRLGQPAQAMEQFQAALKLQPNFPQAEDQLGVAFQKLGQLDEARRHFAEAVRLRPDLAHAQLKLGLLLAEQRQFDEARNHLERVTELEPTNDVAWYNLAGVLVAQGRWEEAASDFGKVVRLKPNDVEAHLRMGGALAHAGKPEAVIAEYERAAELTEYREPRILAALDQAYANAGRFEEAIKTAQAAQASATALNQPALAEEAAHRLGRYRAGK